MPTLKSKSPSRTSKETIKRPKSAGGSSHTKNKGGKRTQRSPHSSSDRKTKRSHRSPQRTITKKAKRAESRNRNHDKSKKKAGQKSTRIPNKIFKDAKITWSKRFKHSVKEPDKKNTNNNKRMNLTANNTRSNVKNLLTTESSAKKDSNNQLGLPQKFLGRGQKNDDVKIDPPKTKSQRAICVNTVKHWYSVLDSDTIVDSASSSRENPGSQKAPDKKKSGSRSTLKRLMRRQIWNISKRVIKGNEYWRNLMAENKIDIDKINIDAVDLSLIDVDALGIENKLLKNTVTWFLK